MRTYSYRLSFKKLDEAGFLSHSDLRRIIERGLTGTGLHIHTSGGHKWPSPKISVHHPLPVGVESLHEVITFHLRRFAFPTEIRKQMDSFPFPGLELIDIVPLTDRSSPDIREMSFRLIFEHDLPDTITSSEARLRARTAENDSEEHAPDRAHDLQVESRRCSYRTTGENGFLYPDALLKWLRTHTDSTLPPVHQLLKTDMILKR